MENMPQINMPEITPIDPEETIFGDIKRQVQEQNESVLMQSDILKEQNKLLKDNYDKLKEMYDNQVLVNTEAREDLVRSRNVNRWMLFIAVISMLAAIASPIITILVTL